ncbi:MAG TPA: hypothetical protein VGJ94_07340 [Syntrophorhabdaceae bacterium]
MGRVLRDFFAGSMIVAAGFILSLAALILFLILWLIFNILGFFVKILFYIFLFFAALWGVGYLYRNLREGK